MILVLFEYQQQLCQPLQKSSRQTYSKHQKSIKHHPQKKILKKNCEEHHIKPSSKKSPGTAKKSSPLTKKLFNTSPNKPKHQQTRKTSPETNKYSIQKIREKYRKMNPNYEKIDQTDQFFKKSIQKLKKSFFKNDKNSKQTTKKILKEIGKYAQYKSKNKPKRQSSDKKAEERKCKAIPVQFYGFKENSQIKKTQRQRQQLQKETYLNFQRAYQISIGQNNQQINSIDFKNPNVKYLDKQSRKKQSFFQDHQDFQPAEKDKIGQKQIDIICQIFEFCDKHSQSDVITLQDLGQLIKQLQRLFVIQNAQKSQQKSYKHQLKPEIRFYTLLNELQEDIKVIFYRKHQNNIYDALYYLRQTNHLQLVCEDFQKIKKCLNL